MNNDKENKKQDEELAGNSKSGQSGKDISNSLERDAVGQNGSNNPTPQNRTDNEQDSERQKNQQ